MSDPNIITQRQIQTLQNGHERLRKADVPALYLPWSQRTLNPFPLASSGGVWGDMPLPWAVSVLALFVTVYVVTTNNGTNFWTLTFSAGSSAVTVGSATTAAVSANTLTRIAIAPSSQPSTTDSQIYLTLTATLSPGSIFIFPAVALLRTGN